MTFDEWRIWRGCWSKHRHATRAKARKAVRKSGGRYGRPYPCIYGCDGWHVGHSRWGVAA